MTPENQRLEIAKACGWTGFGERCYSDDGTMALCGKLRGSNREWDDVPDYLNSLDAMHEAEKTLTGKTFPHPHVEDHTLPIYLKYRPELYLVATGEEEPYDTPVPQEVLCATAAQRAEAFLKTLGLWKG